VTIRRILITDSGAMYIFEWYFRLFDSLNIYLKICIQYSLLLLFAISATKVIKMLLFLSFKYFSSSNSIFDSSIIVSLKRPALFFTWLYCFDEAFELLLWQANIPYIKAVVSCKYLVVYTLILVFLMGSMVQIKKRFILKKERDGMAIDYAGIDTVEKLSKDSIIIIWSVMTLGRMGFNLHALLAFGGAGGVLVGFAGKDLLANIIGGLMIYMDKPFAIGDWISSKDKEIEGYVEYIGWRQTRILSLKYVPLYVPNSLFSVIVIENNSRMQARVIDELMSVRYLDIDKIEKITSEVTTMLKKHPGINKKCRLIATFMKTTNGLLTLRIHAFTIAIDFFRHHETKQDVLLKAIQIIKSNGAEVSYSTNTVYLSQTSLPMV